VDLQILFPPEREKELEREVAGYSENVADADLVQVSHQEVAESHAPLHRVPPPRRNLL
jgi:hypothetical protein